MKSAAPLTPVENWRAIGAQAAACNRSLDHALRSAPNRDVEDWIRQGWDNWQARHSDQRRAA